MLLSYIERMEKCFSNIIMEHFTHIKVDSSIMIFISIVSFVPLSTYPLQCYFEANPRHLPGEGNGNPLQYSCLENPMNRGVWQATVHGVTRVRHELVTKPNQQTSSVQFSCSVMSDSLWPHRRQHARLLYPSPTPGACSKSCPLSQWCHPTISSSVVPFFSFLQSFPASGFYKWISSLHQVAKVLEFQLQHQSFQWTHRTDLL